MYGSVSGRIGALILVCGMTANAFASLADDQYAIAARHYSNSRWQLAVDEFKVFLSDFSADERVGTVLFFLAESHVQLRDFPAAEQRYREYLQRFPDEKYARKALFRLGEAAYLDGDFEQAVESLEQFRREFPHDELNSYLLAYLGEISLAQEQPELAEDFFSEGLQQFPDGAMSNECRYGMARAMDSQGKSDAAIRFYRYLARAESRHSLSDDAQLQLAMLLVKQQQYGEAIAELENFHHQFPGNELAPHAWYWLGTAYLAEHRWGDASKALGEGIRQFPRHSLTPAMQFSAAEAYRELGQDNEAASRYRQIIQQSPDSRWADDSLQSLVQLAWQQHEFSKVVELSEEFAAECSDSPLRWLVQQTAGRALIKQGEFAAAAKVFERLVRADEQQSAAVPTEQESEEDQDNEQTDRQLEIAAAAESLRVKTDPANHYYLALAYLGLERYQEALQLLKPLADGDVTTQLADGVLVARASALIGLNQYDQAVTPLQKFLSRKSSGDDAVKCRAQLCVALARLGRWPEAIEVFAIFKSANETDALYLPTVQYLAEAAYGQHRQNEAKLLFEELAREGNPAEYRTRGLSGMAWLQWESGDGAAESAETFEQLLREFPESPLAAEAAMMRGQSLEKLGELNAAITMYQLVFEDYADSKHVAEALLSAARLHDQLEQDHDAERLLRRLIEPEGDLQAPDARVLGTAIYQLAWVLVDMQREEEADRWFERLRSDFPESEYWADATYRLAERATRAVDIDRADELAQEIIDSQSAPQMICHAHYLRGQLAATQDRWADVVKQMGTVVHDYADSKLLLPAEYWLAEAYYRLRDHKAAEKWLDHLEQQVQGRTDPWIAMVPLRRAQVAAHQGRWSDAFQLAKSIATRFPNFERQYEADYLLGRYYARLADFEQARAAYRAVVRSATGGKTETAAMAQWMIGETYFLQNEFDLAIRAYYRVEGLYGYHRWRAAAILQAGKCHEMKGSWGEAMRLYARLLEEFPDTKFAPKASIRLRVAQQRAELAERR
jgi:TolA-binding protein